MAQYIDGTDLYQPMLLSAPFDDSIPPPGPVRAMDATPDGRNRRMFSDGEYSNAAVYARMPLTTCAGSTPVGFVWDAKLSRYVRTVGGVRVLTASGVPVAKPNVLVQYCQIVADRSDHDVNGNPTMYTKTVGSGRVVLFRGGKQINGTWSRSGAGAPTRFTDSAGKPLLFAPGGTFVALVRPGAPV